MVCVAPGSSSCPHPSPRRLAFCSPAVRALGGGLKLGLERSEHSHLESDSPEKHRWMFFQRPQVLTEFSRISNGLLRAQTVPELSDSCQHLGLVLRETLCKSNDYMWALLGHLTSPSYFPLSWEAGSAALTGDVVSLRLTRVRKCEHWNGSGPHMAGRLAHFLLFHILGFHAHQRICKERSDT